MAKWHLITKESPAPEGVIVETKIDDGRGIRNVQKLQRLRQLWFLPDMSVYVYYQPTHWRECVDTVKTKDYDNLRKN